MPKPVKPVPRKTAPAKASRAPAKASPAPAPAKPAKAPPRAARTPAKASPAPVPAPAPAPAPPVLRQPLGVYLNHNRNTAIAFKHSENGLWYLTMVTGCITLEHVGEEKFRRDFDIPLLTYPFRRAVKMYKDSLITRDEQVNKVLTVLLRNT